MNVVWPAGSRMGWIDSARGRRVFVHARDPLAAHAAREAHGSVVLLPSLGVEATVAYRTMHALAAACSRAGFVALLPDLTGTGDSSPLAPDDDPVAAWTEDVAALVRLARSSVAGPVHLVGLGLGGALAWHAAGALPAADVEDGAEAAIGTVVAWEPVSGRAFARRQRALRRVLLTIPADEHGAEWELPGLVLSPAHERGLRALTAPADPGPRRIVRVEPDREIADRIAHVSPYLAEVPTHAIGEIVAALPRRAPGPYAPATPATRVTLRLPDGSTVEEECVVFGPHRLTGILTRPVASTAPAPDALLFTALGAEVRSGPCGVWTETVRDLAGRGYVSLRADRRGIGGSVDPLAVREPLPYTDEAVEDVVEAARFLRGSTGRPVVGVGLCVGGWLLLRAAAHAGLEHVVAVNVMVWNAQASRYDRAFFDRWHGVGPPAGPDVAPPGRAAGLATTLERTRRWSARRLAASPRLSACRERAEGLSAARRNGSLGASVLWGLPRSTSLDLLFSSDDEERFVASGGRLVVAALTRAGRRIRIASLGAPDHALRARITRRLWREHLEDTLARRRARAVEAGPWPAPGPADPTTEPTTHHKECET